ncbi:hypothetical protein BGE01nite_37400 [Brevifollis gellanilyticus]|uniref:Uncharacterized protein n=2 Tax=Brevifollis gellanilyticus TaxID=748831 RepID=A0A512MCI9_9BACT|nr:hypothetical protein BGE01nite_37400 [Brevifollis gellanilyticus]
MLEDPKMRHLVLAFAVMQALWLWEEITDSLSKMSVAEYGLSVDESQYYKLQLEQWLGTELPRRVNVIIDHLFSSEAGLPIAVLFLRNHSVYVGPQGREDSSRSLFHEGLLNQFVVRKIDPASQEAPGPETHTSLLARARFAIRLSSQQDLESAFSAYSEWLHNSNYIWHEQLLGQDKALVEALSQVLAQLGNAEVIAHELLNSLKVAAQGWKFDLGSWLASLPALTHGIMVIALAAACVHQNGGPSSRTQSLMQTAWAALDSLLNSAPDELQPAKITTPVTYVWASTAAVRSTYSHNVEASLSAIDDPALLILAARNFRLNGGELSPDARHVIRTKFDEQKPLLALSRKHSSAELTQLSKEVDDLCTDAPNSLPD